MSVTVSIPSAFRRHTEGADKYDCAAADLPTYSTPWAAASPNSSRTSAMTRATCAAS